MPRLAALPPNYFAIAFGITGLALSWRAAHAVVAVPGAVAGELRNPVTSPYLAVPAIVALLLCAGLHPHAPAASRIIGLVALVVVVLLGGWLAGQWIAGTTVDLQRMHPGYFLPTVAGGFVGANVMAVLDYRTLAWLSFGVGVVCWMQLGSAILNRLMVGPPLPAALVPTLAIEVAPPAVAGNAYFALHPGGADPILYILTGFCVLSVVVQVRFVPLYRGLPFAATFWGFTFSYTAVATFALNWIARERPAQAALLTWIVLGAITAFVAAVAVKSIRAAAAGRFFPALAPSAATAP